MFEKAKCLRIYKVSNYHNLSVSKTKAVLVYAVKKQRGVQVYLNLLLTWALDRYGQSQVQIPTLAGKSFRSPLTGEQEGLQSWSGK